MILSKMHDWQGDPSIKQVLVFWNRFEKERFDFRFAEKVADHGIDASENGLGAIAKIRAVLSSDGTWEAIVRNGFDGSLIDAGDNDHDTPEQAIQNGLKLLQQMSYVPDFEV